MNVQDYQVTELFGCQPGYPLNQSICPPGQGYHNGIDYGCPSGTPIVVNDVVIGISGATGAVTGPHVHVGRWVNGKSTDPGVGNGFNFNNAVVSEVGQDPTNGKFVALNADGARWVYLHMSDNSKVKMGQVLKGEFMGKWNNGDTYNLLFHACNAAIAKRAQDANFVGFFGLQDGMDAKQAFNDIISSPQFDFLVAEARGGGESTNYNKVGSIDGVGDVYKKD